MSSTAIQWFGSALGHVAPSWAARLAQHVAITPGAVARRFWLPASPRLAPEPVTFRFGLAGLRWGEGPRRVLAIHGWQGHAAQFQSIAEHLVPQGFQLIAIDGPAHGRSPGEWATPLLFSDAIEEAAAEIGPTHAVIGHSMGGAASLIALARSLHASRAVVLAAPSSLRRVLLGIAHRLGLPRIATRRFLERMERLGGSALDSVDAEALARHVHQPVMVVHDRDDRIIPFSEGARLADLLPAAQLHETRGLGHGRVLKDAGVAQALASFLMQPAQTFTQTTRQYAGNLIAA